MSFDYETLELLRKNHPSWKLLNAQHAPFIASFLHRVFLVPNIRMMAQSDLKEALEDELFVLREKQGSEAFKGTSQSYLNDWAENDKGWLRKFYIDGTDEPYFDVTPATEKAITWLASLTQRAFVGTESRLLTLFELLRQMSEGSEVDPQVRMAELHKRRDAIDYEIEQLATGRISILDDSALKDRFQQFLQLARDLLTDFREVEHNFRELDRRVRERITLWEGSKGKLLEEIMGERDAIADSDQGKSFHAFWDFLMSQSRQDEFSKMIYQVLSLEPIREMQPGNRMHRVHYDWLEAGEHTQRMVARLSEQLRHFLDDKAWLENRRIMDILRSVESHAIALRDHLPDGPFMEIADMYASIELPLERPLYKPSIKPVIADLLIQNGHADVDVAVLYQQVVIHKAGLQAHIRHELNSNNQISLSEIINRHPLQHGLAELVTYLQIAASTDSIIQRTVVDEETKELVYWQTENGLQRQAVLPRIIFVRGGM
ncbi:MAG: DUF3375 domain-containing protein [Clostridia bacterium]|nr:DUF3375 domain-containing protein [Clostridia bacterium]